VSRTIMLRSILATAGVGILTAAALIGSTSSQAASDTVEGSTSGALGLSKPVPAALAVPAGQVLTAAFAAQGVQVYQCTAGAWVFVEPAASLIGLAPGSRGIRTAVHFRGPSWESTTDGSLVTATSVANSPVPGSIPELLLKSATNRGTGLFGKVSYIQRLNTTGGAAPAGSCTDGQTTGVPYTAKYRFYSPTS
jgi:hypothetical protein